MALAPGSSPEDGIIAFCNEERAVHVVKIKGTDFAKVELHPEQLHLLQRAISIPHIRRFLFPDLEVKGEND